MKLLIIGAGPGGYECALRAAEQGHDVTLIDGADRLGGTCLTEGCIPTKCLCHAAQLLAASKEATEMGLTPPPTDLSPCLEAAMRRKKEVVQTLKGGIEAMLQAAKVNFVSGKAHFAKGDAKVVMVDGTAYAADRVIIATGSVTKYLPIPGAHSAGVVTSTELLQLSAAPRRLCIIGGGVIGLEFASIFQQFGSEVTVVEYCKEVLPAFDRDLAKRLRTALKKQGVRFELGAAVTEIVPLAPTVDVAHPSLVRAEAKGKKLEVEADLVLMAVGRAANVEALNLDEVGIAYSPKGIVVDDDMQTNIAGVYAIGDVNGRCQLAHAATHQGYRALAHINGEAPHTDLSLVPAAVFTAPEAAMVGLTEEVLKEKGIAYSAHKSFYRANGKALSMNATEGLVKILCDEAGHILGAHILGAHASDLIHEVALTMRLSGTLHDIATTIHAHPSLSELVMTAR